MWHRPKFDTFLILQYPPPPPKTPPAPNSPTNRPRQFARVLPRSGDSGLARPPDAAIFASLFAKLSVICRLILDLGRRTPRPTPSSHLSTPSPARSKATGAPHAVARGKLKIEIWMAMAKQRKRQAKCFDLLIS
ncbi:hypothetical protein C7M84_025226 [Penaeus vannamei]|uniref:Uncharacterized protein n=1 Tax=Penaeus vannamei TaxID=6689 RepID=A0A3R7PZ21_PENVA|nr:hypothetical protein C7M84_025226 [Penaeus vannamei]